jgi:hypothetical protein
VLRKIFGSRRNKVTWEWRRLHKEELYDLYCSLSITRVIKSRRIRCVGHVPCLGERRGTYRILVGKCDGNISFRSPRLDGSILLKWIFKKWDGVIDWINLAQDRDWRPDVVNAVMNLRFP